MGRDDILPISIIAFVMSMFASWSTAIIVSLKRGDWLLGIVDLIIPPIGVVHGYGIWFGVW